MNQEYSVGFSVGKTMGERDANKLLTPSAKPFTSDNEEYEIGFGYGYILGYTKTMSEQLKIQTSNDKKIVIIQRLEELSECMDKQNEITSKRLVLK